LHENDQYLTYVKSLPKDSLYVFRSSLKTYLSWRNIPLEELIRNGLEEQTFFDLYVNDETIPPKRQTKNVKISNIKKFLRYIGINFSLHERKKIIYFEKDEMMRAYMDMAGESWSSQKTANRSITNYAKFCEKTPTQLIEEASNGSTKVSQLRLQIIRFHKTLKGKYTWYQIMHILRFYNLLAEVVIEIPSGMKQKRPKKRLFETENKITKELVRKLLEVADLRDSLVVMALYESGLNSVDICTIQYDQVKNHLNLEDPEEISHVAVIPHFRAKTKVEFLACFGIQSLRLMSKWMKVRKEGLLGWKETITDESPIFTQKQTPFQALRNTTIYPIFNRLSTIAGVKLVKPSDFRSNFNTALKPVLKWYDKELFMGHTGGIERHYDTSDLEYFTEEYRKAWEILFDLTYDNEKVLSLEEENVEIKKALKDVYYMLDEFLLILSDISDSPKIDEKELKKMINRVREIW